MRFRSDVSLVAQGEVIRREAGFWESVGSMFGAKPNLDTGRVRTNMTTAMLLSGVKKALARCGVTDAILLTIDGQALFEDRVGQGDDIGDLFTAFYENEMVFGQGFKELVLAVEHVEAGVHYILELEARGEHEADEATVKLRVGGRIIEFEPRVGEDAETFRKRVEPHLTSPVFSEAHRLQFESFMARVRDALVAGLPEVRVGEAKALATVVKPSKTRAKRRPARRGEVGYDPYACYVPSMLTELAMLQFWNGMALWSWHPGYEVVDTAGHVLGAADAMGSLEVYDIADLPDVSDIADGVDVGGVVDAADAASGFDLSDIDLDIF